MWLLSGCEDFQPASFFFNQITYPAFTVICVVSINWRPDFEGRQTEPASFCISGCVYKTTSFLLGFWKVLRIDGNIVKTKTIPICEND